MEFAPILKSNLSRKLVDDIALIVSDDNSVFDEIFELIEHSDEKICWRATWACEKIVDLNPELFTVSHFEKINSLVLNTKHDGQRRILLSIILKLQRTYSIPVSVINSCFNWIISDNQPIAVQSLALKLLVAFCQTEPDFKIELLAYLENYAFQMNSPAMISTRKYALKQLIKR